METLIINVPAKKSALVKQLLKELGVKINSQSTQDKEPNKLTAKTIEEAHKSIGLNEPIKDIKSFINSL